MHNKKMLGCTCFIINSSSVSQYIFIFFRDSELAKYSHMTFLRRLAFPRIIDADAVVVFLEVVPLHGKRHLRGDRGCRWLLLLLIHVQRPDQMFEI